MKRLSFRRIASGILQIFAALALVILLRAGLNAQILANPSLEGSTSSSSVPPSWTNCGGSPDTQIINGSGNGIFGINTPADDGITYLGFVSTSYGYIEAAGQATSLSSGTAYTGSLALYRSTLHSSWNGTGQCQIWGGTSCSNRTELLWSSGTITNLNNWQTYAVTLQPTMNHSYIIFVNYFNSGTGSMDYFCLDDIVLAATVLPVEMQSFTAEDRETAVDLHWMTDELATPHTFQVEWSGDAKEFTAIGSVEAERGESQFSLVHPDPQPGMNYYRLQVIDVNGETTFSEIRQVEHAASHFVNVFPNPTHADLNVNLRLYDNERVDVKVMDAAGRAVYASSSELPAGSQLLTLPLSEDLAQGLYHLEVRVGNEVAYEKITLQK